MEKFWFNNFRIRKAVLVSFTIVFLISGCTLFTWGYRFADWIVLHAIRDHVNLDVEQNQKLKKEVEAYFDWHRSVMLPLYAGFLFRCSDSLEKELRPEQYAAAHAEYLLLRQKTLEPVVDKAHRFLLGLRQDQIKEYQNSLEKKNEKLRKDFSYTREHLLEERYKKTLDEMENWTGKLDSEQKIKVREWSLALPWNGRLWLEWRKQMQAEMFRLLRPPSDSAELRLFLRDYFLDPKKHRSPVFLQHTLGYESGMRDFILDVYGILTPKQKSRFLSKVRNIAQDFQKMSEKK